MGVGGPVEGEFHGGDIEIDPGSSGNSIRKDTEAGSSGSARGQCPVPRRHRGSAGHTDSPGL